MRRVPLSPIEAGTRVLPARAAHYLKVLRVSAGEVIEVFDPSTGAVARARVVDPHTLAVEEVRVEPRVPPLVLVQGYPKGDKLSDVVRDATELGATLIVPAICARSVARPDASKAAGRAERLASVAAEAARQCGRSRAPEIAPPMNLDEALDLAHQHVAHGFVLWERATTPLGPDLVRLEAAHGVAFAIGPEGGLTDDEIACAERHGFGARSLGSTILRTETAATAVLGAYRVLAG